MSFYVERRVIRKIPGTVIGAVPLPKPKLIEDFDGDDSKSIRGTLL